MKFATRLLVTLLAVAIGTTAASAALFYWRQQKLGERERSRRGGTLLRTLALEAELCAYARDATLCDPVVRAVLAEEDVVWVALHDASGKELVTRARPSVTAPALPAQTLAKLISDVDAQPSQMLVGDVEDWSLPIVTRAQERRVAAFEEPGVASPAREVIGVARIGLSRRVTDEQRHEVVVAGLGLALAVAVLGALGSFLVSRRVTSRVRTMNEQLESEVQGRTDALDGLIRELTERNATLARQRDQLSEMNQLKSQFLANTSHELRTPLNAVIGYTELITEGVYGPVTPDQRSALDAVDESSRTLLELINQILDLSKVEAGHVDLAVAEVPLREVAEAVAHAAEPLCKNREYRVSVVGPAITVRTDRGKLQQILSNLVSNAIKFTERGTVTIEIVPEGPQTRIHVRDTGLGIKPEHQEIIFEEFRQVDGSSTRQYGGTGLGLAISRSFADLLGAKLTVQSEYGVGSTFTLTLPGAA